MSSEDPEVRYTVREMFDRLDRKIDQFLSILTSKADRTVTDDHENRIGVLEHHMKKQETAKEFRRWLIPALSTAILALATVVSVLLLTLH